MNDNDGPPMVHIPGAPQTQTPVQGRCVGLTKRGARCTRPVVSPGSAHCVLHGDPATASAHQKMLAERAKEKRAERVAMATAIQAERVPLRTPGEIRRVLERTVAELFNGTCAADRAQAIARLCGVQLETIRTIEEQRELSELREQVKAIRERTATDAQGWGNA